jgi:hypothetical protein
VATSACSHMIRACSCMRAPNSAACSAVRSALDEFDPSQLPMRGESRAGQLSDNGSPFPAHHVWCARCGCLALSVVSVCFVSIGAMAGEEIRAIDAQPPNCKAVIIESNIVDNE